MDAPFSLTTDRLFIQPLNIKDDNFIFELVNTEGWLSFIGNRNITSQVEAGAYIQKILANKNITYWIVKLQANEVPIGIITFIKRDYLEHQDIGFAFLPNVTKNGYAYEAATAVLNSLIRERNLTRILATTVPENSRSIKLLQKMGFTFEKEMEVGSETLHVYGLSTDK